MPPPQGFCRCLLVERSNLMRTSFAVAFPRVTSFSVHSVSFWEASEEMDRPVTALPLASSSLMAPNVILKKSSGLTPEKTLNFGALPTNSIFIAWAGGRIWALAAKSASSSETALKDERGMAYRRRESVDSKRGE